MLLMEKKIVCMAINESLYELANRICFILRDRGSGHITMFIIIMLFIAVVFIHRVLTLSFLKFYFRTSIH